MARQTCDVNDHTGWKKARESEERNLGRKRRKSRGKGLAKRGWKTVTVRRANRKVKILEVHRDRYKFFHPRNRYAKISVTFDIATRH